jgi:hypothetical protein
MKQMDLFMFYRMLQDRSYKFQRRFEKRKDLEENWNSLGTQDENKQKTTQKTKKMSNTDPTKI